MLYRMDFIPARGTFMPYLIDTPEGWFRQHQRDIHILKYKVFKNFYDLPKRRQKIIEKRYRKDCDALEQWFQACLPHTELTILGPSEYSGYIIGGPAVKVADFDQAGLATFLEHWKPGQRWRVAMERYADWETNLASTRLLTVPNVREQACRWWDTPQGFILLSCCQDGRQLSLGDAGWRLCQFYPEFTGVDNYAYPCGVYSPAKDGGRAYIICAYGNIGTTEWAGDDYIKNEHRMGELRSALGLLPTDQVTGVVDDY